MPPILALFVLPLVLAASPLSLVGPLMPILLWAGIGDAIQPLVQRAIRDIRGTEGCA